MAATGAQLTKMTGEMAEVKENATKLGNWQRGQEGRLPETIKRHDNLRTETVDWQVDRAGGPVGSHHGQHQHAGDSRQLHT